MKSTIHFQGIEAQISGFRMYHQLLQPPHSNACAGNKCDHLCLLTPTGYVCVSVCLTLVGGISVTISVYLHLLGMFVCLCVCLQQFVFITKPDCVCLSVCLFVCVVRMFVVYVCRLGRGRFYFS